MLPVSSLGHSVVLPRLLGWDVRQNDDHFLAFLLAITSSELTAASGVVQRTLYTLLSILTKQGALERQQLPGRRTGYRVRGEGGGNVARSQPADTAALA
jgi:undecaprenyl pyrophosphate phosphatase UppP